MKAMIMAAGFGTRLRPLTNKIPKALVPVLNRPVLERNIEYLGKYGIRDIIINAHYHADRIAEFISSCKIPQVSLIASPENEILGTGGGIANCRKFLEHNTFLVINSDIITNIDLDSAIKNHMESGDAATMVLHDCARFNQIDVTGDSKIKGIHKTIAPGRLAFTGIHVLDPAIFDLLPEKGYADIISSCYNPMLESGRSVNAYQTAGHFWYDIGTIESYKKASMDLLDMENKQFATGEDIILDKSVILKNWAVIGNNVTIDKNVIIDSSIIWDNAVIKNGMHIKDSIVISTDEIIQTTPEPH